MRFAENSQEGLPAPLGRGLPSEVHAFGKRFPPDWYVLEEPT